MYGENGTRLRTELGVLLSRHRVQLHIGGGGTHTVPVTTTTEERQQIGEQIRRYRQSALVWCHQGTVAVAPTAVSALVRAPTNPFLAASEPHGALHAMQRTLEHTVRTSTAALPTLDELTTPHALPLVESWRQVARAAALGEHDFTTGLGQGRLDSRQQQTVIGDISAVVRALVVLDQRYRNIPGWEKLSHADRLGWGALACALDASLAPPDYSVDLRGWRPPIKLITGPAKPGLLGVLQAQHNLVLRMRTFPNALNLRLVVDSQRLLSGSISKLVQPVEPDLAEKWSAREQTYTTLQQELRNVAGNIGRGNLAVAEGSYAVSRATALTADNDLDPRALHGLDRLFDRLDHRIADVIDDGVRRNTYVARVSMPQLAADSGRMTAGLAERHVPFSASDRLDLSELIKSRLRPSSTPLAPPAAARSRAELHAAIVHRPRGRGNSIEM